VFRQGMVVRVKTGIGNSKLAGKVECYSDQHVVLATFFVYGYMNPRIANTIARVLISWEFFGASS
jgi:hypothetical protein